MNIEVRAKDRAQQSKLSIIDCDMTRARTRKRHTFVRILFALD